MGPGQQPDFRADFPHRPGLPAVYARLPRHDGVADDATLQLFNHLGDLAVAPALLALFHDGGDALGPDLLQAFAPAQLVLYGVGFPDQIGAPALHLVLQLLVNLRRCPVPGLGASLRRQLLDVVDDHLHLLVAVHDRAQHDFL